MFVFPISRPYPLPAFLFSYFEDIWGIWQAKSAWLFLTLAYIWTYLTRLRLALKRSGERERQKRQTDGDTEDSDSDVVRAAWGSDLMKASLALESQFFEDPRVWHGNSRITRGTTRKKKTWENKCLCSSPVDRRLELSAALSSFKTPPGTSQDLVAWPGGRIWGRFPVRCVI